MQLFQQLDVVSDHVSRYAAYLAAVLESLEY